MTPAKDNGNLKRGPIEPKGRKKPPGNPGNLAPGGYHGQSTTDNFDRDRAYRQTVYDKVTADSNAALEEILKDLTMLTKRILKKAERSGEVPPRATMEVIKEFRQTQEAVNEARRARGDVAEFEEWAAQVDARVAEATRRLENGPEPAVAVPA